MAASAFAWHGQINQPAFYFARTSDLIDKDPRIV
jgi:hypothetical protein